MIVYGGLAKPITPEEVYRLLGVGRRADGWDAGYICSNLHGKTNKWAPNKPFRAAILGDATGLASTKDYGLRPPAATSSAATLLSDQHQWTYEPPTGGKESPYNMSMWNMYVHTAVPPVEHYDFNLRQYSTQPKIEIPLQGNNHSRIGVGTVSTLAGKNVTLLGIGSDNKAAAVAGVAEITSTAKTLTLTRAHLGIPATAITEMDIPKDPATGEPLEGGDEYGHFPRSYFKYVVAAVTGGKGKPFGTAFALPSSKRHGTVVYQPDVFDCACSIAGLGGSACTFGNPYYKPVPGRPKAYVKILPDWDNVKSPQLLISVRNQDPEQVTIPSYLPFYVKVENNVMGYSPRWWSCEGGEWWDIDTTDPNHSIAGAPTHRYKKIDTSSTKSLTIESGQTRYYGIMLYDLLYARNAEQLTRNRLKPYTGSAEADYLPSTPLELKPSPEAILVGMKRDGCSITVTPRPVPRDFSIGYYIPQMSVTCDITTDTYD